MVVLFKELSNKTKYHRRIKMAKLISAKDYFVTAESENKTKFLQNKKTGRMIGRTVGKPSDGLKNLRARHDIDLDGKAGIGEQDIHGGSILGRLKKGESKPDRIEVENHYKKVNGKNVFVSHHIRKIH
jgi:hypothetical protein